MGWFNTKAGLPTDPEVLFLAAMVATNGSTAKEQFEWSSQIWRAHKDYQTQGASALGLPANWSSTNKLGEVFEPLRLGYTGATEWSSERLGRIADAMKLWEGTGQKDGMDAGWLKSHRQNVNAKKRWRSIDVLFAVAKLLAQEGKHLRRLLKHDESVDELPSSWEQLVDARQVRVCPHDSTQA